MWAAADSAVPSSEPVGMAPAGPRPLPLPLCGMPVSVPALQPPRTLGRHLCGGRAVWGGGSGSSWAASIADAVSG